MLSIQQLIKALRRLQNNNTAINGGDLIKGIKHVAAAATVTNSEGIPAVIKVVPTATNVPATFTTSHANNIESRNTEELPNTNVTMKTSSLPEQPEQTNANTPSNGDSSTSCFVYGSSTSCSNRSDGNISSQTQTLDCHVSHNECFSLYSPLNVDGSKDLCGHGENSITQDSSIAQISPSSPTQKQQTTHTNSHYHHHQFYNNQIQQQQQRSRRIQNFFQQQIFHQFQQFHTQHNKYLKAKHKQTQFAMSSLAAEPLTTPTLQQKDDHQHQAPSSDDESSKAPPASKHQNSTSGKPCFNTGLGDILQFMELIGNLKHTKRTGWVLRDVNDCESISGHMYRMSILTFLLDGTEGLNQVRCMELALVHDLAESLVGDITPFCGISKEEKKAMEFKAMEDICKLIEPRGKRMMELFEEYETGESPESRFVKDLDRLDMVMQAFEYEKRDNCLLKHQEFFDSTEGKFNHPFVKKLVGEIYEQREKLAKAKGATPPPKIEVPNMDDPTTYATKTTNGHHNCAKASIENNVETSKTS